MTIEITGAPELPLSDPPDVLQQDGVQTQDQAMDGHSISLKPVESIARRWVELTQAACAERMCGAPACNRRHCLCRRPWWQRGSGAIALSPARLH
jgi:hypothetical protein